MSLVAKCFQCIYSENWLMSWGFYQGKICEGHGNAGMSLGRDPGCCWSEEPCVTGSKKRTTKFLLLGCGSSSQPAFNSGAGSWEIREYVQEHFCSWCPMQSPGSSTTAQHLWESALLKMFFARLCSWPWEHVSWTILTAFLADCQTKNVPALDHTAYCSSRPPW